MTDDELLTFLTNMGCGGSERNASSKCKFSLGLSAVLVLYLCWFPFCQIFKVDKSIARLQELQFTVTGGTKVISGVTLSPRSTRGYLRTSLRCKQESLRYKLREDFLMWDYLFPI